MKLNVLKEYIRRLRKVLKSKLNGGNLIHGVNTCAVSLLKLVSTIFDQIYIFNQTVEQKTMKYFFYFI